MVRGELKTVTERRGTQPMSPLISGMSMGTMPRMVEEVAISPHWEEGTGEKKGFIIKREKTRKLTVEGFRCTLCGFIELYAREK